MSVLLLRPIPLWMMLVPVLLGAALGLPFVSSILDTLALDSPAQPAFPWGLVGALALAGAGAVGLGAYLHRQGAPVRTAHRAVTQDALDRTGALLDQEAAKVVALITSSVGSHSAYAESLGGMEARIAAGETPAQLRAIVTWLASENHRMRLESTSMVQQLDQSRAQIDSLHSSLQQANDEVLRDALTMVGNRRAFDRTLEAAVQASRAGRGPLSIIMCDIDHFKSINDRHGHQIGDEVLKIVARLLRECVREGDTVTRYGGEEFAVIMPRTPSLAAGMVAERMRARIEAEILEIRDKPDEHVKLTASFGVGQFRPVEVADDLVQRADARLYKAKANGRNRVITM